MVVRYGRDAAETVIAEDIAAKIGIGKNTVLRALGKGEEGSDLRLDSLVRLANFFGASPTDLLQDYRRPRPRGKHRAKPDPASETAPKVGLQRRAS